MKLKARYAEDYKRAPDLDMVLVAARENAALIAELEKQRRSLEADLAAEHSIDAAEFRRRFDLTAIPTRMAANTLLKRLSVLVHAGRDGYAVSKKGELVFCMGYSKDKDTAGFRDLSPWPKHRQQESDALHIAAEKALKAAGPLYFTPPLEAGPLAYALEEDIDQARFDALEGEGQAAAGEY